MFHVKQLVKCVDNTPTEVWAKFGVKRPMANGIYVVRTAQQRRSATTGKLVEEQVITLEGLTNTITSWGEFAYNSRRFKSIEDTSDPEATKVTEKEPTKVPEKIEK